MHRHGHIFRFGFKNFVDAGDILAADGVDIDAACGVGGAFFLRAKLAPTRVVELQIAFGVEREHGVFPGLRDVGKEFVFLVFV